MTSKHSSASHRESMRLIGACWLVYMSAYVGRNTFKAAIAPIVAAGIMSNTHAGLIETAYFLVYGIGHLVNGILADRTNPYRMIGIGLCGSALANLIMAYTTSYPMMLIVWAANGFLQAMLWSPIIALFSRVINPDLRDTACYRIFTSSPVGTILVYLLVALTSELDFRITFVSASGILFLVYLVFFMISKRARPHLRSHRMQRADKEMADIKNTPKFLPLLLKTGIPLIVLSTVMHGMLKEGVLTWVPSLISDTYSLSPSFSVFLSMLLPIASLAGSFLSKTVYKHLFRRHEILTAIFFMSLSLLPILAVSMMAKLPIALSLLCLCSVSMLMTAFNFMFSAMTPMRFSKMGRSATISGIFNFSVYLGSALSTYLFGSLSDTHGWDITVIFWIGIAAASAVLLLPVLPLWKKIRVE